LADRGARGPEREVEFTGERVIIPAGLLRYKFVNVGKRAAGHRRREGASARRAWRGRGGLTVGRVTL